MYFAPLVVDTKGRQDGLINIRSLAKKYSDTVFAYMDRTVCRCKPTTDATEPLLLKEGFQQHPGPRASILFQLLYSFVTVSCTSNHLLIVLLMVKENSSSNYVQISYMGGKYFEYLIYQKSLF